MQIDFYILENASEQKSQFFACQLIEKMYAQEKSVYIKVNSLEEAERLDNLLWSYNDANFLPHTIYQAEEQFAPPIQIGTQVAKKKHDVLINLATVIPENYTQYEQIIEIVQPEAQEAARTRFKHYRDQGNQINTHKMKV